jgi:hypothetical protein
MFQLLTFLNGLKKRVPNYQKTLENSMRIGGKKKKNIERSFGRGKKCHFGSVVAALPGSVAKSSAASA